MKTIKATKHDQAVKELNAIDKEVGKGLELGVNPTNRKYYHAILVRVQDRPGQVKNKVTASVQVYHKPGFEKLTKNPAFFGCNKVILLHDPSLLEEEEEIQVPQHVTTAAKSAATKQADENRQKEIDDAVAKAKAEWIQEQKEKEEKAKKDAENKGDQKPAEEVELTDDQKKEALEADFAKAMAGNKPELEAFLNKYGIGHADLTNNEGRKQRIKVWFEAEMEKFEGEEEEVNLIDKYAEQLDASEEDLIQFASDNEIEIRVPGSEDENLSGDDLKLAIATWLDNQSQE